MKLNILDGNSLSEKLQKKCHYLAALTDEAVGERFGIVNLILCDDRTIRRLNRSYRGQDKVTDVLSFSYDQEKSSKKNLLGEIFIDLHQAKRQAKGAKRSFEVELYTLCIHGLLHLRGYDHEKMADYRVMKLLEEKIMNSFLGSKKT